MIATPVSPRSQVKEALLESIRRQDVGTRLAPERRLAEEFGVSRSTMTKVLEELVKEGYLSRRIGSGTFIMPRDSEIASTRLPVRAANSSSPRPTSSRTLCGNGCTPWKSGRCAKICRWSI